MSPPQHAAHAPRFRFERTSSDRPGFLLRCVRGCAFGLLLTVLLALAAPLSAGEFPPTGARSGVDIARAAAAAWAGDASLIYLENDAGLDGQGASPRWGYLFYSPAQDQARAYSVRAGKIVAAEDLPMKFQAPPVAAEWIDSGRALEVAEREVGRAFRKEHRATLGTMLLVRGAFQNDDATTWTLIYNAPHEAPLFVIVDAIEGRVRRTWRG